MIVSGSHILVGTLRLRAPLAVIIDRWQATQPTRDEYAARDRSWWIEGITQLDGDQLMLFEETRSSYARVELTRSLIDALTAASLSGSVTLHHTDNGVHIYEWTVRDGKTSYANRERKRARSPAVELSVRVLFERKAAEIAARYGAIPEDKKLAEFIAVTAKYRALCLVGGTTEQRRQLAEAIHRRHRPGTPLQELASGSYDGVFVPDLAALPHGVQGSLCEALREAEPCHLYLGMSADPARAVLEGTLREDLHYRATGWPRWTLDAE